MLVGGGAGKVNFEVHFGQKIHFSGLYGIGYWKWSISTLLATDLSHVLGIGC